MTKDSKQESELVTLKVKKKKKKAPKVQTKAFDEQYPKADICQSTLPGTTLHRKGQLRAELERLCDEYTGSWDICPIHNSSVELEKIVQTLKEYLEL